MNAFQKFKAKRLGVKVNNFANISMESRLLMEEHSRFGNVTIKLPFPSQQLTIGAYSYMREGGEVFFLDSIGRYCSIGRGVVLGQAPDNHPIHWVSTSMSVSKNYVAKDEYSSIGHDVWIAHDAVIMAGVKVATGAVIGRNAVVTKDVEPYTIAVGNPAKPVRKRFSDEQIAGLLASEWWNLDHQELGVLPFDDVDAFLSKVATISKLSSYRKIKIEARKVSRD